MFCLDLVTNVKSEFTIYRGSGARYSIISNSGVKYGSLLHLFRCIISDRWIYTVVFFWPFLARSWLSPCDPWPC